MSKMNELDLCVGELRSAAQSLNSVADNLVTLFSGNQPEPSAKPDSKATTPKTKTLTLEDVRAVLAEKSRSGYTAEVRALLEAHGASRLSEIDPVEYPALLAESEVIGNG